MKCRPQLSLIALVVVAGCEANVDGWTKDDPGAPPDDVQQALAALPEARVLEWTNDGLPKYIVGEMVKMGAMQSDDPAASDAALRPMIVAVLKPFRLTNAVLTLRKMNVDDDGYRHFRYVQTFNGLAVVGAALV